MTANVSSRSKPSTKPKVASKTQAVLRLLRRKQGASLDELCKATGWQPHSVRGLLSATFRKRMQLDVRCEQLASGQRRYRIAPEGDR